MDLTLAGLLLLGSLPGALTAIAVLTVARDRGVDPNLVVRRGLGAALLISSVVMLARRFASGRPRPRTLALDRRWFAAAGVVAGLLVETWITATGQALAPDRLAGLAAKITEITT